jgi:DNA-binding transcriptional regulator YiaG
LHWVQNISNGGLIEMYVESQREGSKSLYLAELREYRKFLCEAGTEGTHDFSRAIRSAFELLELHPEDLMRMLGTSRGTILRWSEGAVSPMSARQVGIYERLGELVDDAIGGYSE